MAGVSIQDALLLVKQRLNRLDNTLDEYLTARIAAAADELEQAGITLTDSMGDLLLVVDSTCWAYANRDAQAGMPDWLRLRRRERWLKERRGGVEA